MAIIIRSVSNDFIINGSTYVIATSLQLPIYGSVEKANNYFGWKLHCQKWQTFDNTEKFKGLLQATKLIEKLNYVGSIAVEGQPLQFPRGTDTLVPVAIEEACYEIAYALLKGVNPTTERENLYTLVQGYGQLRTEYRNDTVRPWIAAGIPSVEAWDLLYPYLQARMELGIFRS